MTDIRMLSRVLALVAVLAVAPVAGGCGDSDDGGGDANASVANTPEEQALLDANDKLSKAIYAGDAKTYCSGQTAASRRSNARSLGSSCEEMVATVAELAKKRRSGVKVSHPKVTAVKVDGNRGTITTWSRIERDSSTFNFVKRDGRWLSDIRAPSDTQPQPSASP
jgi:hypothetical protein